MKVNQPAQYLDHMLRQTRAHHVQLSSMADLKANMLLTISSVMVTMTAPHVFNPRFGVCAFILIVFSLTAILCAAYAVMPKLRAKKANEPQPDLRNPGFNLLFFGDFTHLTYPEFEASMEEVMNDPNRTYEVQVREIYTLGVFLSQKKYRFLRYAYIAFLSGLLVSGFSLLIQYFRFRGVA
jgi:hypothetical protein